MNNIEFAITDVETTGLFPERSDRILEIAIIRVNQDGAKTKEYTTLINPMRDVGPTEIHGIRPRDLKSAPTFDEIAGDVVAQLSGAVVVAHNAAFDIRFLSTEFKRVSIPFPKIPYVCTMHLAQSISTPPPGRSLECACDFLGLAKSPNHSAYSDAEATVALFCHCIQNLKASGDFSWQSLRLTGALCAMNQWPSLPCSGKTCPRIWECDEKQTMPSFLSNLVARLPSYSDQTAHVTDYLALLDRVLEDRRITDAEGELLFSRAQELGLLREQVGAAHHSYLFDLTRMAYQDHSLTTDEARDLEDVRRLLSISRNEFDVMIADAEACSNLESVLHHSGDAARSLNGRRVCFTGSFQCILNGKKIERTQAEEMARAKGLIVDKNVTKRLDFLVAADTETMSTKAQKARDYGIRLVAETDFWRMLKIDVD